MKLTHKILASAVVAAGLAFSSSAMADMKIGIVNYMQVFQQAPQGNATLQQLKSQLQPQLDSLKKQQAALAKQAQSLDKNGATMTKADRTSQTNALEKKQQAFQGEVDSLRNQEMKKEQTAANNFEQALQTAVNQVAQNGSYDMIVTSQATPYYSPKYDVTSSVVKIMQGMNSSSN